MNEAQAAEQIMRESIDRADPEVLGRYCRVTAYQAEKDQGQEIENLRAENKALREAHSAALMVTTTKTLEYVSGQKISS